MAEYDLSGVATPLPDAQESDAPATKYAMIAGQQVEVLADIDYSDTRRGGGGETTPYKVTNPREDAFREEGSSDRDYEAEIAAMESAIKRQEKEQRTNLDVASLRVCAALVEDITKNEAFQEYINSTEAYLEDVDDITVAPEFVRKVQEVFGDHIDESDIRHVIAFYGYTDEQVNLFADVLLNRKPKDQQIQKAFQNFENQGQESTPSSDTESRELRQLREENRQLRKQLEPRPVEREEVDVETLAATYDKQLKEIKNSSFKNLSDSEYDYLVDATIDYFNKLSPKDQKKYDSKEGTVKLMKTITNHWDNLRTKRGRTQQQQPQKKYMFKHSEIEAMSFSEYQKYADKITYAYLNGLVDKKR